jgi:hypothetical protein
MFGYPRGVGQRLDKPYILTAASRPAGARFLFLLRPSCRCASLRRSYCFEIKAPARTCLMPFWICVQSASPLEIFLPQACEGEGEERTLPFFFLLHDDVYEALRDFIRHFRNVYLFAGRKLCLDAIDHEFSDFNAKGLTHRDTQLTQPPTRPQYHGGHTLHVLVFAVDNVHALFLRKQPITGARQAATGPSMYFDVIYSFGIDFGGAILFLLVDKYEKDKVGAFAVKAASAIRPLRLLRLGALR